MELIKFCTNEPALILEQSPTKRSLVIADLHLGFEHTLIDKGVLIPSQTQTQHLINKLKKIIEQVQPSQLIILGDIKHKVQTVSDVEWEIVPFFFENFIDLPIHVILGNHDSAAQIEALTTRNVIIHPVQGYLIILEKDGNPVKIGLFHGHTWPDKNLFNTDFLIMAHNHPVIQFMSEMRVSTYEPAWIIAQWSKLRIMNAYLKYLNVKKSKDPQKLLKEKYHIEVASNPEIIIMPAFNDLLGGIPFNAKDSKPIGPLLKSNALNIDEAKVVLLDGTILGSIKEIRIAQTKFKEISR